MNGLVLYVLLLVVPGCSQGASLDKTGTSGMRFEGIASKTLEKQEPAEAGSFLTERAGFEPAVRFYSYAALAKRCWRQRGTLDVGANLIPVRHFVRLSLASAQVSSQGVAPGVAETGIGSSVAERETASESLVVYRRVHAVAVWLLATGDLGVSLYLFVRGDTLPKANSPQSRMRRPLCPGSQQPSRSCLEQPSLPRPNCRRVRNTPTRPA